MRRVQRMIAIVIESFFKHSSDRKEFGRKYNNIIANYPIISVNQRTAKINIQDIDYVYNKYENEYVPIFEANCVSGKLLLIEISTYEEAQTEYSQLNADVVFVSTNEISCFENENASNGFLKLFITFNTLERNGEDLKRIFELKKKVIHKLEKENFEEVSIIYKELAELHNKLGLINAAKDYYAYAAIAAEKTEKWRNISFLWYSAYEPMDKEHDYQDYNSLAHTYPSISFEKWSSFSNAEKRGRALQYAAYSDENHGGPSDSYWIFESAAFEYLNAGNYGRAIECAVSATNRYALCYHQIKPEIINLWKQLLDNPEKTQYLDLLYISFSDIYRNLNLFQSEDADYFYIQAQKIQQEKLIKNKKYGKLIVNKCWSLMTKYGTNISRIAVLTALLVLVIFPLAYYFCQYTFPVNWSELSVDVLYRFLDCIKISLNTFFSVGEVPNIDGVFYLFTLAETFYAYIALVIISTSIIGKLLTQKM